MSLHVLEGMPEGLLALPAPRLGEVLNGPTLIRLPGARHPALFVSVLLHGNEIGGWEAVRELLSRNASLPRAMDLFIGNVDAARAGARHLDSQPDYNRIWRGPFDCPGGKAIEALLHRLRAEPPFASIDLHNNTGVNPHYACVSHLDDAMLALAADFAPMAVYVRTPNTTQMSTVGEICPAITLESGRPGEIWGVDHMRRYVEQVLGLEDVPTKPSRPLTLYHTVVTIKIAPATKFSFERDSGADIELLPEFEHTNFQELPAETLLGFARNGRIPLEVTDESGADVRDDYFYNDNGEVRLRRSVVPSMFTEDTRIIRQDCLCYLMEPYGLRVD